MAAKGSIPDWLYESLPYLYLAAGGFTAYSMPNAIGIFSGVMLFMASVVVWAMRTRYRKLAREMATQRRQSRLMRSDENLVGKDLMRLVWRPEYECGHAVIDAQHRGLFEYGNNLLNAIIEDQSKLDVELLLDELIAHVEAHFCDEEAILAGARQPLSQQHMETHRQLLVRARALSDSYHRGERTVGDIFTFVAHDVISQHIKQEDLKLSPTA